MNLSANKVYLAVASLIFLISPLTSAAPLLDIYTLQGFEGDNFVTRPEASSDSHTYREWAFYPSDKAGNTRRGTAVFSNEQGLGSNRSLKVTSDGVDAGIDSATNIQNIFAQYYPYDGESYQYRYIREQEAFKGNTGYQRDRYNRMRFWVKVPSVHTPSTIGQTNFHVGTYYRATSGDRGSAESGGNHFYHYYNLPYMEGSWHQVIVDTHPSHIRGDKGANETGNKEYPTGEAGYNYFDLMTRFYFQVKSAPSSYPAEYYFDNVEFYHDPNPENIDQIYSIHGSYSSANNKVLVGWLRDKDENSVNHEVRYAFNDIHSIGWDNAQAAPSGTVSPPGWQGYNGMQYQTSNITMADNEFIYIAIKPQNSNLFRQIIIPLSDAFAPEPGPTLAPPSPPSYLGAEIAPAN